MTTDLNRSQNADDMSSRKGDHIRLCLDPRSQAASSPFGNYRLPYNALPELALDEVSSATQLCGKPLAMPFIIASMTGGSVHGQTINRNLAAAAEHCGVAMGVGSQRIGLEKPAAARSFAVIRQQAPRACIIANMGAAQLNYGHTVDSYRRVVDMVEADALYLHLNPLQEALQPGGDGDFRGLLAKIERLVSVMPVPVFVKEVGHGIAGQVAERLFAVGVAAVDCGGVGGTSYAWVEAERARQPAFGEWFKTYGVPSDQAVQQAASAKQRPNQLVIASGGVRSPLDGLVAHALGADLFSAAAPFLEPAMTSAEAVINQLNDWQRGLQIALFASGCADWPAARQLALTPAI